MKLLTDEMRLRGGPFLHPAKWKIYLGAIRLPVPNALIRNAIVMDVE